LDRLLKLMPALRALKFDQMRVTHGAAQYSPDLGFSAESMIGTEVVGTNQGAIVTSQGCPAIDRFVGAPTNTRPTRSLRLNFSRDRRCKRVAELFASQALQKKARRAPDLSYWSDE
jgi:hypothetical protein